MADPAKALATQLANIQKKTGRSLDELRATIAATGLEKHGQIRDWLKAELGLGHGDANTLAAVALDPSRAAPAAPAAGSGLEAEVARIYDGPKAVLRPVHDRVMALARSLGEFEVAPKKSYLSLRRRKQFAMVGPATKSEVELGLNLKGVEAGGRLKAVPQPGMCQLKLRLATAAEVDDEVAEWLRQAYEQAG